MYNKKRRTGKVSRVSYWYPRRPSWRASVLASTPAPLARERPREHVWHLCYADSL